MHNKMKKAILFISLVICPSLIFCQIGIGTETPNSSSILELNSTSKGLLLPRLTSVQRDSMDNTLGLDDVGMMVYQISPQKGIYCWDGVKWMGMPQITSSTHTNGATLRYDGTSWVSTMNLFNSGSSIGIGLREPKSQLHISSISPFTTLRLTTENTGELTRDGFVIGVSNVTKQAFLNQHEEKALWFATDSTERLRIDSAGNVGINRTNPTAKLDVNGNVKLGTNGSVLNGILHNSVEIDLPNMGPNSYYVANVVFPNAMMMGSVHVSPDQELNDILIGYARVSSPGNIEIKFRNMSTNASIDFSAMMFHVSVIQ